MGTTAIDLPKVPDSYTPTWVGAEFPQVPMERSTRILLTPVDRDLVNDDPMGLVELNVQDIAAAYNTARVHHVRVAEQPNQQLLFVDISLRHE